MFPQIKTQYITHPCSVSVAPGSVHKSFVCCIFLRIVYFYRYWVCKRWWAIILINFGVKKEQVVKLRNVVCYSYCFLFKFTKSCFLDRIRVLSFVPVGMIETRRSMYRRVWGKDLHRGTANRKLSNCDEWVLIQEKRAPVEAQLGQVSGNVRAVFFWESKPGWKRVKKKRNQKEHREALIEN